MLAWLAVLVVAGLGAAGLGKSFDNSFSLPGTSSQQALDQLERTFPQVSGTSVQVIFVAPSGESVRDQRERRAIDDALRAYRKIDQVDTVASPFDQHIDGAIAPQNRAALISVQLAADRGAVKQSTLGDITRVTGELRRAVPGSQVSAGGDAFAMNSVSISPTEVVGVVIALVVLTITLGSFVAAGMPLLNAILGVMITMAGIFAATGLAKVNSSTPMLALMLGLAVGIDYALFIVSRHRDQLRDGMEAEESAARSVATAGSAVVFAGLTVMIALAGLAVAGIPFLTTMGIAAAVGVAIAVCIALTLLPASLGFFGDRLRPKQPTTKRNRRPGGFFRGWVKVATRFPVITILVIVAGLGALALPARGLELALPDNGSAAAGTPARVNYDLVARYYGPGYNAPLIVTADIVGSDDPLGVMDDLKEQIEALPGVASVPLATPNADADTGIVRVVPSSSGTSAQTKELVQRIRDLGPAFEREHGTPIAVTGTTAIQIDVSDQLGHALLPFGILVVGLSLVLLTMVFRSIVVPIKATVGYLLSVGASFGMVALVFQHGFLAGPLNVDQQGPVLSFLPIILMGILFGLAMDYEVFLVSRIREDYVHNGRDPRSAIRTGFTSSARVVTAAAVIMFSVFAAFIPEGDATIKSIAVGLATGVFVDAFIVRMTLVPAVLALLGRHAWRLPGWIDRRLPSFDVEGEGLVHMVDLRDWPEPGSTGLLHAEELTVRAGYGARERLIVGSTQVSLQPGEVLVVDGDPEAATSLLWVLSGRMRAFSGRLKTVGMVLPEQAGSVRRRTRLIDLAAPALATSQERVRALVAARDSDAVLIMIDHLDRIAPGAESAALAELVHDAVSNGRGLVLSADAVDRVEALLPGQYLHLTLPTVGRPAARPATVGA
ncbi:MMPL family transporter [Microlunatus sp. Gsoil 973]|nr:MMPL family transporter [Microlunatus sp. Gsoil 973]